MEMMRAFMSKPLSNQVVQCTACEHWCAIQPGQLGKCNVRMNKDGELVSLVYGQAAAAHVDPVEKKPLFHFLPTQPIFSIGTLGCNFHCHFCQNWNISQPKDVAKKPARLGENLLPEEIVSLCQARKIPMIAYTYNEPTVFFEYTYDTAELAVKKGIRNVYVSNGFLTLEAIDKIAPYLHAINVDLKSFSDSFYQEVCSGRLKPILRNIEYLVNKTNVWIEVTTLVVPGMNDSEKELSDIAQFLAGVSVDIPWHISAFRPEYLVRDRPSTPDETLERAYSLGVQAGLRYVYVGNSMDTERSTTYCPNCGETLIRRIWYQVHPLWKQPGVCHSCGTVIAGIWR